MKHIFLSLMLVLAACMPYGLPTAPEQQDGDKKNSADAEVGYGPNVRSDSSDTTTVLPRDTLEIEIIIHVTGGRP